MKKLLITFYSKYLDAYDDPIVSQYAEADLKTLYQRSIYSDPDGAYRGRIQEKCLVVLGTFDDCKGTITLNEKPVTLFDFAPLFPVGYLAKKEASNA